MLTVPVRRYLCPAFNEYLKHCEYIKGTGKEMRLTFAEWEWIWLNSGKFDQRGVGKDKFCMSRVGDKGHYERGNVFIQSFSANVSQAQKGRPKSEAQRLKLGKANKLRSAKPPTQNKPIEIGGVAYPNLLNAAKAHGVARVTLVKRIRQGVIAAKYL